MELYIVGIDMGGTSIKIGLFHYANRTLREKWEIPTRKENHGEHLLPDIASSIKDKLAELGIASNKVEGAGMGVPGAVLEDGFVAPCVNLNGWGGFHPGDALEKLAGFPVLLTNDANAAALGEYNFGGGKGYTSQVFVTLGTGIGGGTIVEGHVVMGSHGAAGEIGHIKVDFDETRVCGCGKRGCLEQYASATGMVACTRIKLSHSDKPSSLREIPAGRLTAKDIFDCAKRGDALALECVDDMASKLGHALASVSTIIDPEVIVIGGGVAKAGTILIDAVKKHFVEAAFPVCEDTRIVLAKLGNDAGIYGAQELVRGVGIL